MASETRWTDIFPEDGVEETFYLRRHKLNHEDVDVGRLRDRTLLFTEGGSQSRSPRKDFEYLGPFTVSDLEQLTALRCVVFQMRQFIEQHGIRVAVCYSCDPPRVCEPTIGVEVSEPFVCQVCVQREFKRIQRRETATAGRLQHGQSFQPSPVKGEKS